MQRRVSEDNSPPRRRCADDDNSPPRRRRTDNNSSSQGSKIVKKEILSPKTDRNGVAHSAMTNDDENGRYALPRQRTTKYRKFRNKDSEDPERREREAKKQKELNEKYEKWRSGIAQTQQREEKLKEMEEVVQGSFTRYADDKTMNNYLKEQIHDELDPMAQYFRTKQHKVQMKEGTVYPMYKGHWPPNRFGIAPGYRWDGVNRSNGFEAKMSLTQNKKKAQEALAYRTMAECVEDPCGGPISAGIIL